MKRRLYWREGNALACMHRFCNEYYCTSRLTIPAHPTGAGYDSSQRNFQHVYVLPSGAENYLFSNSANLVSRMQLASMGWILKEDA